MTDRDATVCRNAWNKFNSIRRDRAYDVSTRTVEPIESDSHDLRPSRLQFTHNTHRQVPSFRAGPAAEGQFVTWHLDWHRYRPSALQETFRFHAQFRREFPCEAFSPGYLILDAVWRGRFLGFIYGVRLYDDRPRWSHAGAENIYRAKIRQWTVHSAQAGDKELCKAGPTFSPQIHTGCRSNHARRIWDWCGSCHGQFGNPSTRTREEVNR